MNDVSPPSNFSWFLMILQSLESNLEKPETQNSFQFQFVQPQFLGPGRSFHIMSSCLCQSFIQPDVSRKRVSTPRHFVRCPHMCHWKWPSPTSSSWCGLTFFGVKLVITDLTWEMMEEVGDIWSDRHTNLWKKGIQIISLNGIHSWETPQQKKVHFGLVPKPTHCHKQLDFFRFSNARLCFWSTSGLGVFSEAASPHCES